MNGYNRLPTKYRLPVLLCYVQGLSCEEAAQRLGCAKGTVFSRLSRARDHLRRRLVRRGVNVSAGALAAVLTENAFLQAAPPLALREMTIRTSLLLVAGTTGNSLSVPLAALVEGVVRSMFLSKVKFVAVVVLAIGIAGAGTGFLGYRTDAQPTEPKENKIKSAPVTPAGGAVKSKAKEEESKSAAAPAVADATEITLDWREKLMKSIEYPGLEDTRATLADALHMLTNQYHVAFDINEKAFEMDEIKDVARTPVADPAPIPPMRASLATVLRKILSRVPAPSGTTYLVRRNLIEITTEAFVQAELGPDTSRSAPPLVCDAFKETPLAQVLPRLAESSGYNVFADSHHAGEKLQTKITAQFNNVPIDTALFLLANMAGLNVARLDNVFYVTTAENANYLRAEHAKIKAGRLGIPVPE